jgi:hypothetical protein
MVTMQEFDWSHCISCGKELGPNNGMQPCRECWKNEMISTLESLPKRKE